MKNFLVLLLIIVVASSASAQAIRFNCAIDYSRRPLIEPDFVLGRNDTTKFQIQSVTDGDGREAFRVKVITNYISNPYGFFLSRGRDGIMQIVEGPLSREDYRIFTRDSCDARRMIYDFRIRQRLIDSIMATKHYPAPPIATPRQVESRVVTYITYDTTLVGYNAIITRPIDWFDKVDSTEGFVSLPGSGEVGTDINELRLHGVHGPNGLGKNGWNGPIVMGNGEHTPIYVSLQATATYTRPWVMKPKLDAFWTKFRIKANARYGIGFSMGGWNLNTIMTYKPTTTDSSYLRIFKAIVTNRGQLGTDTYNSTIPSPQRFGNQARTFNSSTFVIEQKNDGRNGYTLSNNIRDSTGTVGLATRAPILFTVYPGGDAHVDGVDSVFSFAQRSWNYPAHPYGVLIGTGTTSDGIATGLNVYDWLMKQGDSVITVINPGILILQPIDTGVIYRQSGVTPPFSIRAVVSQGTPVSYVWSLFSGPGAVTITNQTQLKATMSNINKAGVYVFRLIATDAGGQKDTVFQNTNVRDWMLKNVSPSRVGPGLKFHLGDFTIGSQVTTTAIYIPYINRDGFFGQDIMGGDTIIIHRNPNSAGKWFAITLGDFGGNRERPVVIMSDTVTTYGGNGGYFRLGTQDSNVVCFTKVDGLANRLTKGVIYGFEYDNPSSVNDHNGIALSMRYVHNMEINGLSIRNSGLGIFCKINSDSTGELQGIYDNFRMSNLYIHDVYMNRINGEAMYIGHTDISGTAQAGNSGMTARGDSLHLDRIILDSTFWDGAQLSNFYYGNLFERIVGYRTGRGDVGGQQWGTFMGGNSNGTFRFSAFANCTGSIGGLGRGTCYFHDNFIDSVYTTSGGATADGMYFSQPWPATLTAQEGKIDSLQVYIYNNIIKNVQRDHVNVANSASTGPSMKKGKIYNNIFITPGAGAVSNVGDTMVGNVTTALYDYETALVNHSAYQVLKYVRANPSKRVSFFDLNPIFVTADAGNNQMITLPANTVVLNGSGQTLSPSYITDYQWIQTVGPNSATIVNPTAASTGVTGLVAGTYIFQLTATDDQGRQASDLVTVVVNAVGAAPSQGPTKYFLPKSIKVISP